MGQRREKESRGADEELHSSRLRDVYKNGIHQKKNCFFQEDIQSKPPISHNNNTAVYFKQKMQFLYNDKTFKVQVCKATYKCYHLQRYLDSFLIRI